MAPDGFLSRAYPSETWKLTRRDTLAAMPAPTLQPGLRHEFTYRVPVEKTVPHLYPESPDFLAMPDVFATGFLVGLIEWTCIQLVNEHLDWPAEMTLGVHVDVSHEAATPPGHRRRRQVRRPDQPSSPTPPPRLPASWLTTSHC